MPHRVRQEICGVFETNDLTKKKQKREHIRSEYEIRKIPTNDKKHKYIKNNKKL